MRDGLVDGPARLAGVGPRLDAEPHSRTKPLESSWRKRSAGLVGGQVVVVEADVAPAARPRCSGRDSQAQAHLAGDELLALVDEGVEGLLERREPEAVVDQLGVAGLEPGLLVGQVALEGQVLEVAVGHDERQAPGTRRSRGS